jgi:hypothetical protein
MRRVPPGNKKSMFQLSQDLCSLDLFSALTLASGFLIIVPSKDRKGIKIYNGFFEFQPPLQKGIEDHENCRSSISGTSG